MGLSILPSGFQATPEQTKAIDSSLNSVSSGIQAATHTSGPAEVSEWLETYSSSFPSLDPSLSGKAAFADSAAVQSPNSYLNMAKQLGGQNALNSFSDLVPMDKVATKLGDASFNHQKNLEGFSTALANLKLEEQPGGIKIPTESEGRKRTESEGRLRIGDPIESQGAIPFIGEAVNKIPTESEGRIRRDDSIESQSYTESEGRIRRDDSIESQSYTESEGRLRAESEGRLRIGDPIGTEARSPIPLVGDALDQVMFIGDIGKSGLQDSTAVATLTGENANSLIQDASVFQRLSDFRGTLQEIVSLNQDIQRK